MAELDYQYIATLVKKARSGDSNAFAELYAATFQKEFRFAFNYLKDEYLAQDALQEAYITAFKNLHKLRDTTLFVSWLNQINFRVCFSFQKKQTRYRIEMSNYLNINAGETIHADDASLEELVVKVDQDEYIMKKVLELPATESQAIIMKYYQDMKLEDIAKVMEVSRSTVKRYLSNGRDKLSITLR